MNKLCKAHPYLGFIVAILLEQKSSLKYGFALAEKLEPELILNSINRIDFYSMNQCPSSTNK